MHAVIWPFFSQLDRMTGKFRLKTCADMQWCMFAASKLRERGCSVGIVTPHQQQCLDELPGCAIPFKHVLENRVRRLHWPMDFVQELKADLYICVHETMAVPIRAAHPGAKIFQFCPSFPDASPWKQDFPMYNAAWNAADLVIGYSALSLNYVRKHSWTRQQVCSMAYDADVLPEFSGGPRDIDLLFIARASATNYTHHVEFMKAVKSFPYRVMYVDVTNYMRANKLVPEEQLFSKQSQEAFYDLLRRSKHVVCLRDDLYGGFSVRQAIRSGAFPLLLDTPCYRELLGNSWPWFVRLESLAGDILRAFGQKHPVTIADESYQAGWKALEKHL